MKSIQEPFDSAYVAQRVKIFQEHFLKGEYLLMKSSTGLTYEIFYHRKFHIVESSEKAKSKIKYSTKLSLNSRLKNEVFFESTVFYRKKIKCYYVKNIISDSDQYDFLLFDQEKEKDLLNILLIRDTTWDNFNVIFKNYSKDMYDEQIRELFRQLKPIVNEENNEGRV